MIDLLPAFIAGCVSVAVVVINNHFQKGKSKADIAAIYQAMLDKETARNKAQKEYADELQKAWDTERKKLVTQNQNLMDQLQEKIVVIERLETYYTAQYAKLQKQICDLEKQLQDAGIIPVTMMTGEKTEPYNQPVRTPRGLRTLK